MRGQLVHDWTNRPSSQGLENRPPGKATISGLLVAPRSRFLRLFCARVKAARQGAGLTQAEIAEKLRIDKSTYSKYEKRTPLPHHLIEPFAVATGADVAAMLTGRSAGKFLHPAKANPPQKPIDKLKSG